MTKQYRQGDVWIELIDDSSAILDQSKKQVTLALGEATGHHHTLHCDKPIRFDAGLTCVELKTPGRLTHQEHATIVLPPGRYRVLRQREYSPEAIRNVAD